MSSVNGEYKRGQAVKLDLEGYTRKLTAEVLSVSVNLVSKWTPVLALVGGCSIPNTGQLAYDSLTKAARAFSPEKLSNRYWSGLVSSRRPSAGRRWRPTWKATTESVTKAPRVTISG